MRLLLALLALFVAGTAHAQALEFVHQPPLRDFQLVVRDQQPDRVILSWVLEGQTVLRYSRMVTLMRFGDLARRTGPRAYLADMRQRIRASCPGAVVRPLRQWTLTPYRMAEIRIDCPLNPASNQPETLFVRAMAGSFDLHVVMVTLRRVRQSDAFAFAERHMAGVMLCGPLNRVRECQAQ